MKILEFSTVLVFSTLISREKLQFYCSVKFWQNPWKCWSLVLFWCHQLKGLIVLKTWKFQEKFVKVVKVRNVLVFSTLISRYWCFEKVKNSTKNLSKCGRSNAVFVFSCFQLWFHEKNSSKNPWKYWCSVLFRCFQLLFHEKKSSKNPGKYWKGTLIISCVALSGRTDHILWPNWLKIEIWPLVTGPDNFY